MKTVQVKEKRERKKGRHNTQTNQNETYAKWVNEKATRRKSKLNFYFNKKRKRN